VGLLTCNSGGNLTGYYTYVMRIYVGASVSITAIQVLSTTSSPITQQVGLYTDNGSGTAPVTRVRSMPVTMPGTGWYSANIADYSAAAGYYWLAVSSTDGVRDAGSGGCYNCNYPNGRIDGNMPASAANYLNSNAASNMLANWTCP
jgi:hypothetical protein